MLNHRYSMRFNLIATIVAVAALGMLFALVSGRTYHELAVENERAALVEQAKIRVSNLRKNLDVESREFAAALQSKLGFLKAFNKRDTKSVERELSKLFDRHPITETEIKPVRFSTYDNKLNLIASVSRVPLKVYPSQSACLNLPALAGRGESIEPQKLMSGMCMVDGRLYYTSIVPLGRPGKTGYLHIVADMFHCLALMEKTYGIPIKLSLSNGTLLYKSAKWPGRESMGKILVAEYPLYANPATNTHLNISVRKDMSSFFDKLERAQFLIMLAAAAATFIVIVVASLVLQKTAINPLETLTVQLRKIRQDKTHLGRHVDVGGNKEIISLATGFNEMTTELKQLYEKLERMAFTDSLTKLPNRALLHDRLQQAIFNARREHKPFAFLMMDLDRFKDINDTLGHQIGDLVLQQVADRLRSKLRESDTVARFGGDEFAILLPAVNAKHAGMAARMLLQALRTPFVIDDHSLDIGASVGITLYPDHGVDANILVRRADVAMYAAKNANSGHAFYDSKMDENNTSRLALLSELRQAIEQEQFVLYYQPKVSLRTNRVTGIEALARWQHPRGELLLPDEFIPLLEQTSLIRSLTVWVLNEALQKSKELHTQGLPISISVNLSVRDLQDPYFADMLSEALAAHEASPSWLELEITESAVMTDPARAMEILTRLSDMGLKLTVDDFGTGYSSLAYLKKLPVTTVKIDKSFVMDMCKDENDAVIVRTSIELAHNLGLDVVAEGVDSKEILQRLKDQGCDAAQGMYVSRPLSAEELGEWLTKSSWSTNQANGKRFKRSGL